MVELNSNVKSVEMVDIKNGWNENGKMKDIFTKDFYKFLIKLHDELQLEFSNAHNSIQFGTYAFEFGIIGRCSTDIYKIVYQGDTDKHLVHPRVIEYLNNKKEK